MQYFEHGRDDPAKKMPGERVEVFLELDDPPYQRDDVVSIWLWEFHPHTNMVHDTGRGNPRNFTHKAHLRIEGDARRFDCERTCRGDDRGRDVLYSADARYGDFEEPPQPL